MKITKDKLILLAAIITPFGLVALGLWKTYQYYQKKQLKDKPKTYEEFVESLRKDAQESE